MPGIIIIIMYSNIELIILVGSHMFIATNVALNKSSTYCIYMYRRYICIIRAHIYKIDHYYNCYKLSFLTYYYDVQILHIV